MVTLHSLFTQDSRNYYCRVENGGQNHRQQIVSTVPIQRRMARKVWIDPDTGERHNFVDSNRIHYRIKCRNGSVLKFTFNQLKGEFEGLSKKAEKYVTLRRIQLEHEHVFGGKVPLGSLGVYGNQLRKLREGLKGSSKEILNSFTIKARKAVISPLSWS